jgi:hypothetical protein
MEQYQDAISLLRAAAEQAVGVISRAADTEDCLRQRVDYLEKALEAEKQNHIEHVKKVKDNFDNEWKAKFENIQKQYDSERAGFEKAIVDAKEIKKSHESLVRENKGQQRRITADKEQYTKEIEALKQENAQLVEDLAEAKHDVKLGHQDIAILRSELQLEKKSNKRLQEELDDLHKQPKKFEAVDSTMKLLQELTRQSANFKKELEIEVAKALAEYGDNMEETKALCESQRSTINTLEAQIIDLLGDRDMREPLLWNGISIRSRFMVQARETLFRDFVEDIDTDLVKIGNSAAHGGDGLADEALLLTGELPREKWSKIFEGVYGKKPGEFGSCPDGLQRVLNCSATIKAVKIAKGGNPCFRVRNEAEKLARTILEEYTKNSESAESSADIQDSIKTLEQSTSEIVHSARGKIFQTEEDKH